MRNKKENGFTIIEIAIVLIVAGSLLAFLGSVLLDFQKKRRVELTEARLEQIKEAMSTYLTKVGKLPCPARRGAAGVNARPGEVNFGRQVNSIDCRGILPNVRAITGFSGTARAVQNGSVPVRDLDLPDETIADGWGNLFTYSVTTNQATIANINDGNPTNDIIYVPGGGDIDVIGLDGTSLLSTPGTADYVVFSHGPDGIGARTVYDNLTTPCGASPAVTGVQIENCSNEAAYANATFLETTQQDGYDDYIIYQAASALNDDIPTGAVIPFNLQYCPKGWTVVEEARGRFIMSVIDSTFSAAEQNVTRRRYNAETSPGNFDYLSPPAPPATPVTADIDYPLGQLETGGTQSDLDRTRFNVPPYIALLYCRKN